MKKKPLIAIVLILSIASAGCASASKKTHTHSYIDTIIDATCVSEGYTLHTCESCGESYQDNYVSALGHIEVIDKSKNPTCTDSGITEGKHCSTCNEILVAQTTIPATGHSKPNSLNICGNCDSFCPITMSSTESSKSLQVNTLVYTSTFLKNNNSFEINFGFYDVYENFLKVPGCISYFSTDSKGNVLHENFIIFREDSYTSDSTITITLDQSSISSTTALATDIYFQIYNIGYFIFDSLSYSIMWSYADFEEVEGVLATIESYTDTANYYYNQANASSYMREYYYSAAASAIENSLPYIEELIFFINGKVDLPSTVEDNPCFQQQVAELYNEALSIASATTFDFAFGLDILLFCADFNMLSLELYTIILNMYSR